MNAWLEWKTIDILLLQLLLTTFATSINAATTIIITIKLFLLTISLKYWNQYNATSTAIIIHIFYTFVTITKTDTWQQVYVATPASGYLGEYCLLWIKLAG